jgi:hypothetical protein
VALKAIARGTVTIRDRRVSDLIEIWVSTDGGSPEKVDEIAATGSLSEGDGETTLGTSGAGDWRLTAWWPPHVGPRAAVTGDFRGISLTANVAARHDRNVVGASMNGAVAAGTDAPTPGGASRRAQYEASAAGDLVVDRAFSVAGTVKIYVSNNGGVRTPVATIVVANKTIRPGDAEVVLGAQKSWTLRGAWIGRDPAPRVTAAGEYNGAPLTALMAVRVDRPDVVERRPEPPPVAAPRRVPEVVVPQAAAPRVAAPKVDPPKNPSARPTASRKPAPGKKAAAAKRPTKPQPAKKPATKAARKKLAKKPAKKPTRSAKKPAKSLRSSTPTKQARRTTARKSPRSR